MSIVIIHTRLSYFLFELLLILAGGIQPVRSSVSFTLRLGRGIIGRVSFLLSRRNLSICQSVEFNNLLEQIRPNSFQLFTKRLFPLHATRMRILRRDQIGVGIRMSLERRHGTSNCHHQSNSQCYARYAFQYT